MAGKNRIIRQGWLEKPERDKLKHTKNVWVGYVREYYVLRSSRCSVGLNPGSPVWYLMEQVLRGFIVRMLEHKNRGTTMKVISMNE